MPEHFESTIPYLLFSRLSRSVIQGGPRTPRNLISNSPNRNGVTGKLNLLVLEEHDTASTSRVTRKFLSGQTTFCFFFEIEQLNMLLELEISECRTTSETG